MRRFWNSRTLCMAVLLAAAFPPGQGASQEYDIFAVRYGTIESFPLRGLLPGAPEGEAVDIAMAFWVLRGEGRVVLVDAGFFRTDWFHRFDVTDYQRPDSALARLEIRPEDVTDVVVTHAHWDHMGGIELFPDATVWIQEEEFAYYTGAAWQDGGRSGGIDPADVVHVVDRNTRGLVRLVDGDDVEILPGIRVFTGARHTFASQYVLVEGPTPFVLASDNAYLYQNVTGEKASATFTPGDRSANVQAVRRMTGLAGDPARVVPGHDPRVFDAFPPVADGVVRVSGGHGEDGPAAQTAPPATLPATRDTIRILAYNIHHGEGMDEALDLERIAALIRSVRPDLVALQEIDSVATRTGGVDQAAVLGGLTGLEPGFGRFMPYQGGAYGMAILSGWPIREVENHRLPDGAEPRSALAATVTSPRTGRQLRLVGVHLYRTAEERLAQAVELERLLARDTVSTILAGDFNSTPDSPVMRHLASRWEVVQKGADHLTYPSHAPEREIDFVMLPRGGGFRVLSQRLLDEPVASDHRPLLVELEWW